MTATIQNAIYCNFQCIASRKHYKTFPRYIFLIWIDAVNSDRKVCFFWQFNPVQIIFLQTSKIAWRGAYLISCYISVYSPSPPEAESDVRQKRGLGSHGHWVRLCLTRRARPISPELFSIWRKFTQSCAEKFSNKGFKSSFEQACFAFFCRWAIAKRAKWLHETIYKFLFFLQNCI